MSALYLQGAGVLGPGLPDWPAARRILSGEQTYQYGPPPQPNPDALPQTERRRGAKTVRWTIAVAQEALQGTDIQPAEVASVFASSSGDGETLHRICETLATPERDVSPTQFHNSVHNAAAGYWSIAAGSRLPSVSLCGHDVSFAVGLIEATAQVQTGKAPVLLVTYDLPYPQPLLAARSIAEPLAVAVLLSREPRSCTLARWTVSLARGAVAIRLPKMLKPEFATNPAVHALSLLAAVARRSAETVQVPYADGCHLRVKSSPWP